MTTKEKLFEAALDLFAEKGFAATSVDEIAESIGIKGPNLYKYYKGKDALFEDLATRNEAAYLENMKFLNDSVASIDSPEALKAFSMGQIRTTMTVDKICKMRKLCNNEQFRSIIIRDKLTEREIIQPREQYTAVFADMMKKGLIAECDPSLLAFEYTAPVTLLIRKSDREPGNLESILKEAEEFIDFFIATHFIKK
jgi:AcrR family transcriptional regulator